MSSFPLRVALLAAFAAVALWWDRRRPAGERHRAGEYGFLAVSLLAGAVGGMAIDSVTSRLSPDYFVYGKGLDPGPGFEGRVLRLGAEAGAVVGGIAGAVLLFVNPTSHQSLRMLRHIGGIAGTALAGGLVAGGLQAVWPVLPRPDFVRFLSGSAGWWFRVTWAAHFGVYLGAIVGLARAVVLVRAPTETPCEGSV